MAYALRERQPNVTHDADEEATTWLHFDDHQRAEQEQRLPQCSLQRDVLREMLARMSARLGVPL
jgi:hypothetical protein